MTTCQAFLTAARIVAKKNKRWWDRGCSVLGGGRGSLQGHYFVEKPEGGMAWEGEAHCRFYARVEAITKMADEKVAA